jgi:UDP-4-amino-4-deoxy-L-arabinose-oxoglutarate aminotransferase
MFDTMRTEFLPFSKPAIDEEDIAAIADVFRSGWITTGPNNAKFEQNFCEYVGCQGSVALASATAGMHLLLEAMGIGEGDEVITPSMTWVSTVNLISLMGATPVFADIDRDTMMVSPAEIERLVSPKTKLIIPVHFAGAPADLDAIYSIADKHGIAVAQDAAHALGTYYKGKHVGHCGTSIYSFHPIKNITTGEGGMFCSDDEELINKIRRLKFHGLGVDAYDRKTQGRSPQAQVLEPGFKYNMTDISAVLGVRQLAKINSFNEQRTEIAMEYRRRFAEIDEIMPLEDPDYQFKHAWHLFIVRLDTEKAGMSRADFTGKLKERNIGTGLHFLAAHTHKYYAEKMNLVGTLPNTEWNSDRICSLPMFPGMSMDDLDDVVNAVKDVLTDA